MDEIHGIMREVPPPIYLLMVGIPLLFTALALGLGWRARQASRQRAGDGPAGRRRPGEDAFGAGVTVAVVPFAFALLMLWGRFG